MDLSPIQIATVGNAAVDVILAIALLYLWRLRPRDDAPAYWAAALALIAVRQSLVLLTPDGVPPPTVVAGLAGALPYFLLYLGTLRFLDCPVQRWRLLALGAALVALVVATFAGERPDGLMLWAAVALLAAINLLTTFAFLRGAREEAEPTYTILATLFFLWVPALLLYPVFGVTPAGRMLYAIPSALLTVATGVALIIATQRRLHLRALRTQAELETANQRFEDIVDTATAWIWESDPERRITYVSPQIAASLGILPEAFIGRRVSETPGILHVDMSEEDAARVSSTKQPFRDVQYWITTTTGKRVRVAISGKPVFDADGRHTGYRGITIDVTENARMRTMLDAITAAVAPAVGAEYFRLLVERLAKDLGASHGIVGRCLPDGRMRTLAAFVDGAHRPPMEYPLDGTPSAATLAEGHCLIEKHAASQYPSDTILAGWGINGYAAMALRDGHGTAIGLVAVLSEKPFPDLELIRSVLSAVAPRASAELERQMAEEALRDSEALFRTVIDHMPVGFHLTDTRGRFVMRNIVIDEWSGVDRSEVLGRSHRDVVDRLPYDSTQIEAELRETVRTRRPVIRERLDRHSGGQDRPLLVCRYPVFDGDGNVQFVATLLTDLTEVKRLETQVRESEALFRTVIDNMPIGFLLTDAQGRIVRRNQTLQSWSQRNASMIGQIPGDPEVASELREVAESRQPLIRERRLLVADGKQRPVLVCRFPIVDSLGALNFVATLVTDLTEVKRLEAQVREREKLFRTVIDNTPMAFQITAPDSRVVLVNRTLQDWLGSDEASLIGRTLRESGHTPADSDRIEGEIREVAATRRTLVYDGIFQPLGRPPRPALVCRFPIIDSAGNVSLVGTICADLTDLKQLEREISRSEARLQRVVTALDRSRQGVIVEDAGNRPIYVNRTAGELMGAEASAVAMLERAGIGAELEAHGAWSGEVIHRTRSGNDAILQASISRLPDGGAVTLLDDATERLERERRQATLERQVQEAQKMDAVGQLAGGIAHDFNNLIGAILGFSRFIAEDSDPQSRIHGYAGRILSASQRARELIQQILTFSRRENAPRQPAPLARLVEESAGLLRATLPSTLTIEVQNDFPEAWSIVNPTQITQILVNLCLNAADAMAGRSGSLRLSLARLPDLDPRLRWLLASDPGSLPKLDIAADPAAESRCYVGALRAGCPYLVLSVRDAGSGIPPEVLARIFDPFFTTKPRGQGTGLGLAVVQRLVLAHDGAIVVTTQPGRGTTFDVILPVSGRSTRDVVEAINRIDGAEPPVAAAASRSRVLVVDDDLHFGDMVSTALDRAGYEVGVCGRPREALDVFAEQPELWDVVVTDQTMPEMSGLEMIGRLKTLHPGLRCILCTGYASGSLTAATAKAGGADAFFHKPVDVGDLLATIERFAAAASAKSDPEQAPPDQPGVR